MSNRALIPYILLILTVLFWSGNFVLGRGIRELIPPVSLNYWRWTGALLILLPFSVSGLVRQRDVIARHWRFILLMGIPSISIFNTFIYQALQTTTTTNTVLINSMVPIMIVVLDRLAFGVRLGRWQIAGVLISLWGLVFIITRGDLSMVLDLRFSRGDLWTLGAGLSWAIYTVMLRQKPKGLDPLVFLTALIVAGIAVLTPVYIFEVLHLGGFQLGLPAMGSLAYVAIFPSVLAYIFYNRGVALVGAGQAGIFFHLMPVFAILLAVAFLGERLSGFHLAGMILIFTGIALTTLTGNRH
jgi:drug/metabolite transporter (DMT)-like permease